MDLKPIHKDGIPAALQKAERYRLLNDSSAAESICLDILSVAPDHQDALRSLLLSITDQFHEGAPDDVARAQAILPKLGTEYARTYYAGIICERRAKAQLRRGTMGASTVAAEWFREAMGFYAKAERLAPASNEEAILRYNTCVRLLERVEPHGPPSKREYEPALE